jgi:cytochrome b
MMRNAAKEKSKMILQTMITLASAALGLVAALAWNDAIKALIKEILGENEGLGALFLYAILATVIAIVVLLILASAAARIGGEAAIDREAEG